MTLPYSDAYFVSRLPPRVHRDLPGRARGRLRVLRRRARCAPAMTTPPSRSARSIGRERELDHRVPAAGEPLPLRAPLLPGAPGQREGPRRDPRRLLRGGTCWCRSRRSPSLAALNEYLAAACYADLFRRVRGKAETKAERLAADRAAMLALPAESFEARRVDQARRQLALPRALRPQRLLGADRLRPS